jgi:hypothetical protein
MFKMPFDQVQKRDNLNIIRVRTYVKLLLGRNERAFPIV